MKMANVFAAYIDSSDTWGFQQESYDSQIGFYTNAWVNNSRESTEETTTHPCSYFYQVGKEDEVGFTPTRITINDTNGILTVAGRQKNVASILSKSFRVSSPSPRFFNLRESLRNRRPARIIVSNIVTDSDAELTNIKDYLGLNEEEAEAISRSEEFEAHGGGHGEIVSEEFGAESNCEQELLQCREALSRIEHITEGFPMDVSDAAIAYIHNVCETVLKGERPAHTNIPDFDAESFGADGDDTCTHRYDRVVRGDTDYLRCDNCGGILHKDLVEIQNPSIPCPRCDCDYCNRTGTKQERHMKIIELVNEYYSMGLMPYGSKFRAEEFGAEGFPKRMKCRNCKNWEYIRGVAMNDFTNDDEGKWRCRECFYDNPTHKVVILGRGSPKPFEAEEFGADEEEEDWQKANRIMKLLRIVARKATGSNARYAKTYAIEAESAYYQYGMEGLTTQVAYVLSNLSGWRGDEAKSVKAELRKLVK